MLKEELSKEIQFLAYSGWSPKEIEEKLGLEPNTIYIHHHDDLMIGYEKHIASYEKLPAKIANKTLDLNAEQRAQRKRLQAKQSYLKRKAAGTLKRTKKRGRPRKESKNSKPNTLHRESHGFFLSSFLSSQLNNLSTIE